MDHLAAQDAVLAVACFQIAVFAKRLGDDMGRQALAEKILIAAKAAVKDRDLAPLSAKTHLVPAIDAKEIEAGGTLTDGVIVGLGANGGLCGRQHWG